MNLATIAYKSIRQRALASSLTALSVALGVMLMVAVLVIFGIVDRTFNQRSIGYDLIVGPKGSDLELVLWTVYRLPQKMEPLPYRYYKSLKEDRRIETAVPIAMGDVTQEGSFPIVGTVPEYFSVPFAPEQDFRVRGKFMPSAFDAVIGARVAKENGWDLGSQLQLVHGGADTGHVHEEKFTVVGVLAPTGTPNDKTVFINLRGFYLLAGHDKPFDEAIRREREFYGEPPLSDSELRALVEQYEKQSGHDHDHGHEGHAHAHDIPDVQKHDIPDVQKEVSAIFVRMDPRYPLLVPIFAAQVNEGFKAQAVNPVQPMQRLMDNLVGNVRTLLLILTGLIIVVSGISIFVSIYNSMADRRREIAIMRALGARRQTVFAIILTESIMLCVGGGVLGLLLGHGLVYVAAPIVEARSGVLVNPLAFEPLEFVLFPVLLVLASLIGFLPGLTAYRTDVARTLAE